MKGYQLGRGKSCYLLYFDELVAYILIFQYRNISSFGRACQGVKCILTKNTCDRE